MKNNRKKTLVKNDSIAIVVTVVVLVYLINGIFEIKKALKEFNEKAFNTTIARNEYSISFSDLALVIDSTLTSRTRPDTARLEDYPFLSDPLNYHVRHFISPYGHHGNIKLLRSENTVLAESFLSDIEANFVILPNKHVSFDIKNLHYKTLMQEIHLKNIVGSFVFGEKIQFQIKELETNLTRLKLKTSDIQVEIDPKEKILGLKAEKLLVNNLTVENIQGKTSRKDGLRKSYYTGRYKFIPVTLRLETEEKNIKTTGKLEIPVRLVDDLLDPEVDQEFSDQEKMIRSQNNPKATAVYLLSVGPKKAAKKREILSTYTRTNNIKKNQEAYVLTFGVNASSEASSEASWMKDIVDRYNAGESDTIVKDLESFKLKSPDSPQVYFGLGWIHSQRNDHQKSVENYSISCSLGLDRACVLAGDHFNFKNKDFDRALIMYQLGCDKNLGNACLKAGIMAQEKDEDTTATDLLKKSCEELKDSAGCYHLARHLHKLERPKKEVISYLELACSEIKPACQLAKTFRSGRSFPIPKKY